MTPRTRIRQATTLAVTAILLGATAACTSGDPAAEETTTASDNGIEPVTVDPGTGGESSDGGGEPSDGGGAGDVQETPEPTAGADADSEGEDLGEISKEQLAAVTAYLDVRENAETIRYPKVEDWEKDLKGVTTTAGYESAMEWFAPNRMSAARSIATTEGYAVKAQPSGCYPNSNYPATDTSIGLQCNLMDLVVDKNGDPIPTTEIDQTYPYFGQQDGPMLVLVKDGDKWLVDADNTYDAS